MIATSVTGGIALPQLPGCNKYSFPRFNVPAAFVSVSPYPIEGSASLNPSLSFFTCSGGLGAPPPLSSLKVDKSYLSLSG